MSATQWIVEVEQPPSVSVEFSPGTEMVVEVEQNFGPSIEYTNTGGVIVELDQSPDAIVQYVTDEGTVIELEAQSPQVVEVYVAGPPGPSGAPGQAGVSYLKYTADGPIGGHRVVRPSTVGKVVYASSTNAVDANSVIGITINAAADGDDVHVQTYAEMTEPSWSWIAGLPVFCGANGLLTQVPPSEGFQLVVATAVAPTVIVIGIKQPIIL